MNNQQLSERFRQHAVEATSVEDFLNRYYRGDRYTGRGKEYAACLRANYERNFQCDGWTFISKHDSNTGRVVAYFGYEARLHV